MINILYLIIIFLISSCGNEEKNEIKSELYGTWFSSCINYNKTSFNYDFDLKRVERTLHSYHDNECVYSDNETIVIYNDVSWNEQTVKESNTNYLNAYKFITHHHGSDVIWYAAEIKNKTYKHGYENNSYVIFETYNK